MRIRDFGTMAIVPALFLAGCPGDGNGRDAGGVCDLDACTAECLGDAGVVAACVADECFCFPLPHDAGDEGEGEAGRG